MAGAATTEDAVELIAFATALREEVVEWLQEKHPQHLKKRPGKKK